MLFPSRLCSCLTAALFPRTRVPSPSAGAPAAGPTSVGVSNLHIPAGDAPTESTSILTTDIAIEAVAELLRSGQCRRVVVLTGAGVSVSAGIPDFRTPGTGLYDNLQEYGLPFAEAVFDLNFFRSDPAPFYRLCQELWPGRYAPTPTHRFIKLLEQKELLVRCYTQNIDSLESAAGLPKDKVVAAHGNFDSASVVTGPSRGERVPIDEVKEAVAQGEPGWRKMVERHEGLVKPDIVFFGEQLPPRFSQCIPPDFAECDLLLVMGTSLVVQPFASLIDRPPQGTPRLLINRERVGEGGYGPYGGGGFQFDAPGTADRFFQGDSDDAVAQLVDACGWRAEFDALAAEPAVEETL